MLNYGPFCKVSDIYNGFVEDRLKFSVPFISPCPAYNKHCQELMDGQIEGMIDKLNLESPFIQWT